MTPCTYSPDIRSTFTSSALRTGGGTSHVSVDRVGQILITASHARTPTGTAVFKVPLTPPSGPGRTGTAALTPTFLDKASARNGNTGRGTVKLSLADVDSGAIVPQSSPRFGGGYVVADQTALELVFAGEHLQRHRPDRPKDPVRARRPPLDELPPRHPVHRRARPHGGPAQDIRLRALQGHGPVRQEHCAGLQRRHFQPGGDGELDQRQVDAIRSALDYGQRPRLSEPQWDPDAAGVGRGERWRVDDARDNGATTAGATTTSRRSKGSSITALIAIIIVIGPAIAADKWLPGMGIVSIRTLALRDETAVPRPARGSGQNGRARRSRHRSRPARP